MVTAPLLRSSCEEVHPGHRRSVLLFLEQDDSVTECLPSLKCSNE